jgi:hypothetical protein
MAFRLLLLTVLLAALVVAPAGASIRLPPPGATFDYQLGGSFPPAPGVKIVDRDRTSRPAVGTYGVCYVNAFQTQPQDAGWWKRRHPELLLRHRGRLVVDGAWNELLLDTSSAAKRAGLARIVGGWFAGCARKGFAAVEPDNLDSWTRSQGGITLAQNRAFARLLIARAHREGLAIAQKNTTELLPSHLGFDFAVAEECQRYGECGAYMRRDGARVSEIEYVDGGGEANFRAACRARGAVLSISYRDRLLAPRGAPGYRSATC